MPVSEEIILSIAGELEAGMKCFLHNETMEIVSYPRELEYDDAHKEFWEDVLSRIKSSMREFIEIDTMNSQEEYWVMESFANEISDRDVADKLRGALRGRKPFAGFKAYIHEMDDVHRDAWFTYRNEALVEFVRKQLK